MCGGCGGEGLGLFSLAGGGGLAPRPGPGRLRYSLFSLGCGLYGGGLGLRIGWRNVLGGIIFHCLLYWRGGKKCGAALGAARSRGKVSKTLRASRGGGESFQPRGACPGSSTVSPGTFWASLQPVSRPSVLLPLTGLL